MPAIPQSRLDGPEYALALRFGYAEAARAAGEARLRRAPANGLLHALLGVAHAYEGRAADAIREGQQAVRMIPPEGDIELGPYVRVQLARIHTMVGQPEKAVDQLEPLLKIPCYLSAGWLRIDPGVHAASGQPALRAAGGEGVAQ